MVTTFSIMGNNNSRKAGLLLVFPFLARVLILITTSFAMSTDHDHNDSGLANFQFGSNAPLDLADVGVGAVCQEDNKDCLECALEIMSALSPSVNLVEHTKWLQFVRSRQLVGSDNLAQLNEIQNKILADTEALLVDKNTDANSDSLDKVETVLTLCRCCVTAAAVASVDVDEGDLNNNIPDILVEDITEYEDEVIVIMN